MCLILIAFRPDAAHDLVVAANRDEWFRRPTAAAHFWTDRPAVFAGRDLEQHGTWLGVSRYGRFAALTNFRDPPAHREGAASRGALVADFLAGDSASLPYLQSVQSVAARYNGFGLLAWDGATLGYMSSRNGQVEALAPGVYGLSNHLLDTPWPKVREGKRRLAAALARPFDTADLLAVVDSTAQAPEDELPETGVGREWERRLSPMRIVAGDYGTRSSSALILDRDGGVAFAERTFDAAGNETGTVTERFRIPGRQRASASS
ncbi:MAG: NRDE family protein [Burkholderiales bacterium]|jgi:uncharacterized protein with NRDE domain|nr:NRDE family protein [Burkholderiales bacterium]